MFGAVFITTFVLGFYVAITVRSTEVFAFTTLIGAYSRMQICRLYK